MSNTQTVISPLSPDDAAEWLRHWCAHEWADGPHGLWVTKFNIRSLRAMQAWLALHTSGPQAVSLLCTTDADIAFRRALRVGLLAQVMGSPFDPGLSVVSVYCLRNGFLDLDGYGYAAWSAATGRPAGDYATARNLPIHRTLN